MKICEVVGLIWGVFSILNDLDGLEKLKMVADIIQAAANVNLSVKTITDVKKSAKGTTDVKSLKPTLTRSED